MFLCAEVALRLVVYYSRRGTCRYKKEYIFICPLSWTNKYGKVNYYKAHPYISYIKKPNCQSPRYPSNNLGYVGKKRIDKEKKSEYRIIVCGDSTSEQNDYDTVEPFDPEVTWPHVMGRELEGLSNKTVEVINASVSAYTSVESLIDFQLRGLPLRPDMAIFNQNLTDAWLCQSVAGYQSDYSHNRKVVLLERRFQLPDCRIFFVYQFLKMRLTASKDALIEHLVKSKRFEKDLDSILENSETFKLNLRSFCSICEANHIIPVLVVWRFNKEAVTTPLGHSFSSDDLDKFKKNLCNNNQIIRTVCDEFKTAVLLDPGEFDNASFRNGDWMHWSISGIQEMGKRAANLLVNVIN